MENWYHISGSVNPADILSRGAMPSSLADMEKWWNGPGWLQFERNN